MHFVAYLNSIYDSTDGHWEVTQDKYPEPEKKPFPSAVPLVCGSPNCLINVAKCG